jgi:putative hydrolase of the HAD superfamily
VAQRARVFAFDLDDTLYPERAFIEGGLVAAGRALEASLPAPLGAGRVFLEVLREDGPFRLFDAGLARLGLERRPERIAGLVAAYRGHDPSIAPFPGVREMLAALRARGAMLAIVTDGYPDVQRRKLDRLGFAAAFDAVVLCGDLRGRAHPKPDPEPFREVERLTGASGGEIVCAGDWPARDFPAPDALGWRTVRARFPGGFHSGDADIRDDRPEARSIEGLARIVIDL